MLHQKTIPFNDDDSVIFLGEKKPPFLSIDNVGVLPSSKVNKIELIVIDDDDVVEEFDQNQASINNCSITTVNNNNNNEKQLVFGSATTNSTSLCSTFSFVSNSTSKTNNCLENNNSEHIEKSHPIQRGILSQSQTLHLDHTYSETVFTCLSSASPCSLPLTNAIKGDHDDNMMPFAMSTAKGTTSDLHPTLDDDHWTNAARSFRTKSSPSSSSSSVLSSDSELTNLTEHDHPHHIINHDTSPDSPDSGLSGSVNSADDLKHMEYEDDLPVPIVTSELQQHTNKVACESVLISTNKTSLIGKEPVKLISKRAHCKWRHCDWPGHYEELAEHIRELHVNLQPFLDSSGRVIQWIKKGNKNNGKTTEAVDDDMCNSELDYNDEDDDAAAAAATGDASDDESQSQGPTCRTTRRSSRGQGLFDYSQNNSTGTFKLRQSDRNTTNHEKQQSQQKYVCLWRGCKVYGKLSSSRQWLERHVLELHSGPKPFKCIVASCGQRFKSQIALQRHVNTHFRSNVSNNSINVSQMEGPKNGTNSGHYHGVGHSRSCDDCCCDCTCHACPNCDTSSSSTNQSESLLKPLPRLDKNRLDSTDSAISLTSSSSDCLPSTSTSLSSKDYDDHNHCHHTAGCCRYPSTGGEIITKNRLLKMSKKATPTYNFKSIASRNFDYYDKFANSVTLNRVRARMRSSIKIDERQQSYRQIKLGPGGKVIPVTIPNKKILKNVEEEDSDSEFDVNQSKPMKKLTNSSERYFLFDQKLFGSAPMKPSLKFSSELVSTFASANGDEPMYRLRWHPTGFLPDIWVKKSQLEDNRTRKVSIDSLPNTWQRSILSNRKKRSLTSSPKTCRTRQSTKKLKQ